MDVLLPPAQADLSIYSVLKLTPYSADFSTVNTFAQWQWCANQIVDIGRAAGFWLLDAVTWIQSQFGYSPSTGQLCFLPDIAPRLRGVYVPPNDIEVAAWLGKSPQSIYNLRGIGKVIEDRSLLDGIEISVWDFDAVLIDGLPEEKRRELAVDYIKAKKDGGYAVSKPDGKNSELIKATRSELRTRAKQTKALVTDLPQAGGATLERHKVWSTVPVWRVRRALTALDKPTNHLPTDHMVDETGNVVPRLIAYEFGMSWMQEPKK